MALKETPTRLAQQVPATGATAEVGGRVPAQILAAAVVSLFSVAHPVSHHSVALIVTVWPQKLCGALRAVAKPTKASDAARAASYAR